MDCPWNDSLFHMVIMPPEEPSAGTNENSIFKVPESLLISPLVTFSNFDSWMKTISGFLFLISLSRKDLFNLLPTPLMFHKMIIIGKEKTSEDISTSSGLLL